MTNRYDFNAIESNTDGVEARELTEKVFLIRKGLRDNSFQVCGVLMRCIDKSGNRKRIC